MQHDLPTGCNLFLMSVVVTVIHQPPDMLLQCLFASSLKADIKRHIDEVEDPVSGFGSLPLFLRDEYLFGAVDRAVDRALDNSLALELRVQGWKPEEGKVVEEKVIVDAEEYFKKCSLVVKDIGEAIRALRALVPEQEKGEDNEENGAEQGEEEEEIDEDV